MKASGLPINRASWLEEDLKRLKDGDAMFWTSKNCPPDLRKSYVEDILAFESVESGTSLFNGLQEQGIDLPAPEKLNEQESAKKIEEVLLALQELQIVLVGFEEMSARQFYWTLWNQTLWEGCYVKKRNSEALTIIDVSHSIPRSEIIKMLEDAAKAGSVH
jgi:hypothetical protein